MKNATIDKIEKAMIDGRCPVCGGLIAFHASGFYRCLACGFNGMEVKNDF